MNAKKILIVDDDSIILKAYKKELEQKGFIIFTASSKEEAVNIAINEKIDIAFLDLIMPDDNGVEICRDIKIYNKNIEVVLMSGYPEEIMLHQVGFIKAGGKDFWLRKPLKENELYETILKICKDQEVE